jgi:hypothetical protein
VRVSGAVCVRCVRRNAVRVVSCGVR